MKRLQLASEGTLRRMCQNAREAFANRDLEGASEIFERLNRLVPGDIGVLLELGRVNGLRYDYEGAERAFERAIQITPEGRKVEVLSDAAQQSRDFYNSALAERYFRRMLDLGHPSPEMLVKFADFCERHRRIEESERLISEALTLNPKCDVAVLAYARMNYRSGRVGDSERLLGALLSSTDRCVRVRAAYELGAILDREGRYDEAMQAFIQAKSLLLPDATPWLNQLQLVRAKITEMRNNISEKHLHRWFDDRQRQDSNLRITILGGHPRSGTTLLEQILDSHEEIISVEETNNFIDYVHFPLKRRLPRGASLIQMCESPPQELLNSTRKSYMEAMEKCVGQSIGSRMVIDKNPSLTFLLPQVVRILPESRFLIVLRDPRDVILSCFMQPLLPVEQVSSAYLKLETAVEEYLSMMSLWAKIAPMLRNPFLEVRYEEMVEDLEPVARKALEFLGVCWDERVLEFDKHARSKSVRSPTYADVTQKIFKRARGRWRNYQKYLEPHLSKLEPIVKALGYE
jgi:tetratricopeptide (TPR) repeat protein